MKYIIDASAVIAVLQLESGHERVSDALIDSAISAVNLVETGTKLIDNGLAPSQVKEAIELLELPVIELDEELSWLAINLRSKTRHKGLSLADRVCLALAIREDAIALTADKIWADLDIGCKIELIR